jgi:nucleoside-diphosphate-sugar epimerase
MDQVYLMMSVVDIGAILTAVTDISLEFAHMRVFVTGASGFIGAAIVPELVAAGHQVLGLARSDASAQALAAAGAGVQRGSLEDVESLRAGAAASDGVIHLAFIHDFSRFQASCETDRHAIGALASALAGSGRPLIVTSGLAAVREPGRPATENDPVPAQSEYPRTSEETALEAAARGVRASVVRLPQVHDPEKQGLITYLIALAREKGVSAFVGDGANRWPAVHVLAAARLYRLALEKGETGARYHAVAEQGVPLRTIAEAIGRRLGVAATSIAADEAAAHFGWLGQFVAADLPASSALTQERLGWNPQGPGLIEDLDSKRHAVT